ERAGGDVSRSERQASDRAGVVLAHIVYSLLEQLRRPPLNVSRVEISGNVGDVARGKRHPPDDVEIPLAVRPGWRGCSEIGCAVGPARDALGGLVDPLSLKRDADQREQDDQDARWHRSLRSRFSRPRGSGQAEDWADD